MNSRHIVNAKTYEILMKQIMNLQRKSPDGKILQSKKLGIKVLSDETDIDKIKAEIDGPSGTPYEGGVFTMILTIPQEFPAVPPKGYFITRIFHPNVAEKGEICVNTLKKDWDPKKISLFNILEVILFKPIIFLKFLKATNFYR